MRCDSTCLAGLVVAGLILAGLWLPFAWSSNHGLGVATYYRGAISYLEEEVQYYPSALDMATRRPPEDAVIQRSYHISFEGLGLTIMASVPFIAALFWFVQRGRWQAAQERAKQSRHQPI
jgi:hypothetical protein